MPDIQTIIYALAGGVLPSLIWLLFWLREDKRHPEPRLLILRTFVLGMIMVPLVLPVQVVLSKISPLITSMSFLFWAFSEEGFKFVAAYFGGLRSREDDEPLDPVIYMITAALGFAAMENAFFLFSSIADGDLVATLITGNQRFVGATLLHTVSSGILGVALALSFYKPRWRWPLGLIAFVAAVAFHTLFNIFLSTAAEFQQVLAFGLVWVGIALLLLLFEKIKTIAR